MGKKVFMIGNAHLDPVWVWQWQEGSAETKATMRSALDRINENSDFIFVCSSSFVYKCIEEFDPEMFEEVKQRVKEERIIIVGGWYIQPDCNSPSGEGFARQSLYGQRYFAEKLGTTAKVGYNVDSFGHNAMMPQILKKSGMHGYVFTRPCEAEKHMDSSLFKWVAPDGSAVTAYRILDRYEYNYADMEDFKARIKDVAETRLDCTDYVMNFYGVGNHGGGPTKHNIELIHTYQRECDDYEVVFGNPNEYFEIVEKNCDIPEYKGDLQHHASGCYSAVSEIKAAVRRCENNLLSAERFSVMSNILLNRAYPADKFKDAWENVLFLHFHDSLGGCCISPVYDDLRCFSGEALSVAQKLTNNALQSISWAIDTSNASKGLPIVVFNPHPWEYKGFVKINKQSFNVFDKNGNPVRIQQVNSPAHNVYGRCDTMLETVIPPMGYNVYYCRDDGDFETATVVSAGDNFIENELLRVEFDCDTGYISRIFDKRRERELLCDKGAVPIVIDETEHDTWSHAKNFFDKEIGVFSKAKLTVIEQGPVRAKLKVVSEYGASSLTQYFSLTSGSELLEVEAEINWNEKHKMLKLAFPVNTENPKAYYEIPYGTIERPCDGEEEPGQMWVASYGDDFGLAMLNDSKYSFSFNERVMKLTVVRSPMFCDHGGPRTEESEYTDIGRHKFKYSLMPMYEKNFEVVIRRSRELNAPIVNILENNHNGYLPEEFSGIEVEGDGVVVSALKRSEDGTGLVLRAYETEGNSHSITFKGALLKAPLTADFEPYSIKTFLLSDDKNEWREVMLTEYDMQ